MSKPIKKMFDNVEELKWYFHGQLCKHENEVEAKLILDMLDHEQKRGEIKKEKPEQYWSPERINKLVKPKGYEVKEDGAD